jgi:2-polyprenyl-3-methyl-5-hydroxy-6-metoxy-1,4-benzoquinol methylase
MASFSTSPEINPGSWPVGDLERVSQCPVCGGSKRHLLYANMRDRVFGCAPGEWSLYVCDGCGTAYLDPRPTIATVGRAYQNYSTHVSGAGVDYATASAWRRFRIAQRNAYLNASYGYHLRPAAWNPLFLGSARRRRFDTFTGFFRFPGPGARVLDIGCGNGSYLWQMRSLGWEVCGVEPDPQSAAHARAAGLDVRAGLLQQQSFPEAHFDGITMTHVIEHLHGPMDTLRRCWELLKPGGQITVTTPNLDSRGHQIFGRDWLHLDPPRHLVLFTEASLRRAMENCGFTVSRPPHPSLKAREIFHASFCLRLAGESRKRGTTLPWPVRLKVDWLAAQANRATRGDPALAEESLLLGRKISG